MIAKSVRVTGKVQGVFYRAWTRQNAGELDLRGWVMNCEDGSVEAHLEGEARNVDRMVQRMEQGPPHADVDALDASEAEVSGSETFEIRH